MLKRLARMFTKTSPGLCVWEAHYFVDWTGGELVCANCGETWANLVPLAA